VELEADVVVPAGADGVVLFAHGSGSSRHSPRNRSVASELQRGGLATVLADLLTPEEEALDASTGELRFDVDLLTARVIGLADRIAADARIGGLPLGLFGASTGAAGALAAAAARPDTVRAVVSRGGRPDLAGDFLPLVRQPTLLVVGELDRVVLELNVEASRQLGGPVRLAVVPGATHLFEEAGALELVAGLAREWFVAHLTVRDG